MFSKPNIIISKCIEFDKCRYDGSIIRSKQIQELKDFVNFIPICPEVELGLGIPRPPIRLIKNEAGIDLVQPATNKILTDKMQEFITTFLSDLPEIDGIILKSRSPSCGVSDVKLYSSQEKGPAIGKTSGLFGERMLREIPNVGIEDEGRLRNARIWEHFLRRIFILSSFREIKKKQSLKELIAFHTKNKFLLMAYHQKNLQLLGRIVSNQLDKPIDILLNNYEKILKESFLKAASCSRNINVIQHIFGFFSKRLTSDEKHYFLEHVQGYKNGKISLAALLGLLESWAIRFNEPYLLNQTFFHPYPSELMHIENVDACSVRDYWK